MNSDIFNRFKLILEEQFPENINGKTLESNTDLFIDLRLDSLDYVELIMAVEEDFHKELRGEQLDEKKLEHLHTIGAIVDYIETAIPTIGINNRAE